jgi:hypothetical protein
MSVLLLSPTGFITRSERVNELVMREGWRRASEGRSRRTFAKTYFPSMRGHQDFPSSDKFAALQSDASAQHEIV